MSATSTSSSSAPARAGDSRAHPRPDRQADPAPRARRLPPRELGNWDQRGLRRRAVHLAGDLVRRGRHAVPAAGALLRRRRDEDLRRRPVPAAPAGLRRDRARRRHLAGVAARATTTSSRGTRRPSGSTRCTATTARIPTEGPCSRAIPVAAGLATSRGSRRSRTRSPQAATTRSTRRAGSCSTRRTRPASTCIRCAWCDGYPCLVHAKADAEVMAVRPMLGHAERHAAASTPRSSGWRPTRPAGWSRAWSWTVAETAKRRSTAADIVVVAAGAANRAKILLRSASGRPPDGPRQRLGPGRPELHVP